MRPPIYSAEVLKLIFSLYTVLPEHGLQGLFVLHSCNVLFFQRWVSPDFGDSSSLSVFLSLSVSLSSRFLHFYLFLLFCPRNPVSILLSVYVLCGFTRIMTLCSGSVSNSQELSKLPNLPSGRVCKGTVMRETRIRRSTGWHRVRNRLVTQFAFRLTSSFFLLHFVEIKSLWNYSAHKLNIPIPFPKWYAKNVDLVHWEYVSEENQRAAEHCFWNPRKVWYHNSFCRRPAIQCFWYSSPLCDCASSLKKYTPHRVASFNDSIHEQNVKMRKIDLLYKWKNAWVSNKLLLISILGFFVVSTAPSFLLLNSPPSFATRKCSIVLFTRHECRFLRVFWITRTLSPP